MRLISAALDGERWIEVIDGGVVIDAEHLGGGPICGDGGNETGKGNYLRRSLTRWGALLRTRKPSGGGE